MDIIKMREGIAILLEGMGVDVSDPNYRETPKRVAKMYQELLTPKVSSYTSFPGGKYDEMIVLRGHKVYAMCPHHLMPVEMKVFVGYLPSNEGDVIGLSKLARVTEEPLNEPILQEAYTDQVAQILQQHTGARGVGVIVTGKHGCMKYRGVRTDADVVTSRMLGFFLERPHVKEEFMRICGVF
jgi:GTP cyclohydrolase I